MLLILLVVLLVLAFLGPAIMKKKDMNRAIKRPQRYASIKFLKISKFCFFISLMASIIFIILASKLQGPSSDKYFILGFISPILTLFFGVLWSHNFRWLKAIQSAKDKKTTET